MTDNSWVESWVKLTWFKKGVKTEGCDHDHVAEMMAQGYTSGELVRETGKEIIRGWWEQKKGE